MRGHSGTDKPEQRTETEAEKTQRKLEQKMQRYVASQKLAGHYIFGHDKEFVSPDEKEAFLKKKAEEEADRLKMGALAFTNANLKTWDLPFCDKDTNYTLYERKEVNGKVKWEAREVYISVKPQEDGSFLVESVPPNRNSFNEELGFLAKMGCSHVTIGKPEGWGNFQVITETFAARLLANSILKKMKTIGSLDMPASLSPDVSDLLRREQPKLWEKIQDEHLRLRENYLTANAFQRLGKPKLLYEKIIAESKNLDAKDKFEFLTGELATQQAMFDRLTRKYDGLGKNEKGEPLSPDELLKKMQKFDPNIKTYKEAQDKLEELSKKRASPDELLKKMQKYDPNIKTHVQAADKLEDLYKQNKPYLEALANECDQLAKHEMQNEKKELNDHADILAKLMTPQDKQQKIQNIDQNILRLQQVNDQDGVAKAEKEKQIYLKAPTTVEELKANQDEVKNLRARASALEDSIQKTTSMSDRMKPKGATYDPNNFNSMIDKHKEKAASPARPSPGKGL